MKTDFKSLNKTTWMIVLFFLVSAIAAMVAFMLLDSLSFQVTASILTLVSAVLFFTFKMSYKEHQSVMKELADKNPVEIVLWLVSASDAEQSALIDFLDEESLLSLKAALETYMDVNHDIDLMPLHHKFIDAL